MQNLKTGHFKKRYSGVVLVETAIVIVLLLMFLLGIIGFGYLFWRAQQITTAARHAARIAIRYGAADGDVTTAISTYFSNEDVDMEYDYVPANINPGEGLPVVISITGENVDPLNLRNFPLIVEAFPETFTATVTMAKEGPSVAP